MSSTYLIIRNSAGRQKVELDDAPITIGRHPGNAVPIKDERLSRYHCVIERTGHVVKVIDQNSRNGTRVNGARITAPVVLRPGDRVKIGATDIEFHGPPLPADLPDDADRPRRTPRRRRRPAAASAGTGSPADPLDLHADDADDELPGSPPTRGIRLRSAPAADADQGAEVLPEDASFDHEKRLRAMIDALPNKSFGESDVRLLNARGQQAAVRDDDPRAAKKRKRKAEADDGSQAGLRLMRLLLLLCARTAASDIHVEPRGEEYLVRIRVDGVMIEATRLHPAIGARLLGVVKVLAELDISQKTAVQDGHFSSAMPDRRVDYRVSFTPVMKGQKLVVRSLDLATTPRHLADLQLPPWMHDNIKQLLKQDSGMLLCCGPTGSGKTTTLYAGIRDIDIHTRNVITIEDPPEYQIEGVTQTPINEQQGNTFSSLLRSILRQDPDVILIGEIRDGETARIALQAAMTGHLVLSTVHARDGIGTIFRLLDLGAEPYLVASALNLVLAQRLVRRLCDHCKTGARPKPQQMVKMGRVADGLDKIYYPVGCPRCLNTGYSGRLAMYELLTTNEDIRDVILQNPNMQQLRKAIDMTLFSSLKNSGYKLVASGVTSLNEIDRVVGVD